MRLMGRISSWTKAWDKLKSWPDDPPPNWNWHLSYFIHLSKCMSVLCLRSAMFTEITPYLRLPSAFRLVSSSLATSEQTLCLFEDEKKISQGNHSSGLLKCMKRTHYQDVFPFVGLLSALWPFRDSCCLSGSILQWLLCTSCIHCITLPLNIYWLS